MAERLSALDVQFLLLEKPNVHYHVAGLSILDPSTRPGGPDGFFEDLKRLYNERQHLIPRFRQKVMFVPFGAGRPVWVDDPDFDLDFHFRQGAPCRSPAARRSCPTTCSGSTRGRSTARSRCGRCTSSRASRTTTSRCSTRRTTR